jgi:hypothetical protein
VVQEVFDWKKVLDCVVAGGHHLNSQNRKQLGVLARLKSKQGLTLAALFTACQQLAGTPSKP